MCRVGDVSGGGGAERYVADIFDHYKSVANPLCDLYFLTDADTVSRLQDVDRLRRVDQILFLKRGKGPLGLVSLGARLVKLCFVHRFDLLHIAMIAPRYLPFLWLIGLAPKAVRPKISITIADCTLAHEYFDRPRREEAQEPTPFWLYRLYFNTVRIDGIYCWYQLFAERFSDGAIRSRPIIVPARYCFVDVERFRPDETKENRVVFAARLYKNKRPLFFLEGVRMALDMAPEIVRNWRFEMYGRGPLEQQVQETIQTLGLGGLVTVAFSPTMTSVFASSKVFVSTQDYENFTSLSMLEAMAAGNAIISRNVGQTLYFVRDGDNGYLLKEDSPRGLGEALVKYFTRPDLHRRFEARSREIAMKEHCLANAFGDIEKYWQRILDQT